jgi:hypothetical protein
VAGEKVGEYDHEIFVCYAKCKKCGKQIVIKKLG